MSIKISFVIPAKDEEKSIEQLYEEIISNVLPITKDIEIIFIDDGSKDGTFDAMSNLARRDERVKVIKLRGNFGKSIALTVGFENSCGKIIITLDGDLQDDPKEIPKFIKKIEEGYDLVSGWKKKRKDPITKTIPSIVVNFLTAAMSGLKIHDVNCGFKAYKRSVVENLHLYGDLYRFIPILASRQNFKIAEIAINHRKRKFGSSKYGFGRFISGWLDLLTLFFITRYLRRPGHFFGTIGLLSLSIGFIIGLYITYLKITTGGIAYHQPLLSLGILLIILGVQLLTTGLFAEMTIFFQKKEDHQKYIVERVNFTKKYPT